MAPDGFRAHLMYKVVIGRCTPCMDFWFAMWLVLASLGAVSYQVGSWTPCHMQRELFASIRHRRQLKSGIDGYTKSGFF